MDKDQQIRERAYRLWQAEGEPHGRDQAHWDQAATETVEEATEPAPAAERASIAASVKTIAAKRPRKPKTG